MKLDPDDVEAIARRVAELLGARTEAPRRYVDAAALARTLGVEREWVYSHATQLGAIRLGGPHGRLRFDLEHVRRVLGGEPGRAHTSRLAPRSTPRPRVAHRAVDRGARSS